MGRREGAGWLGEDVGRGGVIKSGDGKIEIKASRGGGYCKKGRVGREVSSKRSGQKART